MRIMYKYSDTNLDAKHHKSMILTIMQQQLEKHTQDVADFRDLIDWLNTEEVDSISQSDLQFIVDTFGISTRLGIKKWNWWGWRISLSRNDTRTLINALSGTLADILITAIGGIPIVGVFLAIYVIAMRGFLLDKFRSNNGPNGVYIDVNWAMLAAMPSAVGIIWFGNSIRRA